MFRFIRIKCIFTEIQFSDLFFSDELLHKYKFYVKVLGLGENYLRTKYFSFRNNSIFFTHKTGNKKQNPLILIPLNLLLYHVQKNMV